MKNFSDKDLEIEINEEDLLIHELETINFPQYDNGSNTGGGSSAV